MCCFPHLIPRGTEPKREEGLCFFLFFLFCLLCHRCLFSPHLCQVLFKAYQMLTQWVFKSCSIEPLSVCGDKWCNHFLNHSVFVRISDATAFWTTQYLWDLSNVTAFWPRFLVFNPLPLPCFWVSGIIFNSNLLEANTSVILLINSPSNSTHML